MDEMKRVKVLERLLGGSMTHEEAAASLGVTGRQLRRIKAKYAKGGEEALIHGNRGRKPVNTLSEEKKLEVLRLYEEKYHGSNFCRFSQLLKEHEGIAISPSSAGRILKSAGKKAKRPQKRTRKHRPRNRRTQAGMLWQIDATPYDWLGKEFGKFALHAAIDDATGIVVGAFFTQNECLEGYSETMRQGIERYGIPLALYSDKHTIFRSPNEKLTIDEELDGQEVPLSNFGKAMAELDIQHIKAETPQAKGRVERLWETLQDRFPVELRLRQVKSVEAANEALPELLRGHNEKYAVPPAEKDDAYRTLEKGMRLDYVFARRETRKVGGGCSITYKNGTYVPKDERCLLETRTAVEVRETFAGEVIVWHKGRAVELKKVERARPSEKQKESAEEEKAKREPHKPAKDHPWKQGYGRKKKTGAGVAAM